MCALVGPERRVGPLPESQVQPAVRRLTATTNMREHRQTRAWDWNETASSPLISVSQWREIRTKKQPQRHREEIKLGNPVGSPYHKAVGVLKR